MSVFADFTAYVHVSLTSLFHMCRALETYRDNYSERRQNEAPELVKDAMTCLMRCYDKVTGRVGQDEYCDVVWEEDHPLDDAVVKTSTLMHSDMWSNSTTQAVVAQEARAAMGNIMASVEMAVDVKERYVTD